MKCIIFGLGNFGASIATKLTGLGHEVIGVDRDMGRVEAVKELLAYAVCLDSTDQHVMTDLPLREADLVVVAIGEDQGASIMTAAVLKNIGVKRMVSRAISPLHEQVLRAIGVDDIVHPEQEAADHWAKKLCLKGVVDSFELDEDYSIVEVGAPALFVDKTLEELRIRQEYDLLVLAIYKKKMKRNLLGMVREVSEIPGIADARTRIEAKDTLVVFGHNKAIRKFVECW